MELSSSRQTAVTIKSSLEFLQGEALTANLNFTAHLISVTILSLEDALAISGADEKKAA